MKHKKLDCEDQSNYGVYLGTDDGGQLACQSCPDRFRTAWNLLFHAQKVHSLKIYRNYEEIVKEKLKSSVSAREIGTMTEIEFDSIEDEDDELPLQLNEEGLPNKTNRGVGTNVHNDSWNTLNEIEQDCHGNLPNDGTDVHTCEKDNVDPEQILSPEDTPPKQDMKTIPNENQMVLSPTDTELEADSPNQSQETEVSEVSNLPVLPVEIEVGTETEKSLNKGDSGTQSPRKAKESSEHQADDDNHCCNNQDCGVTLMPGTHESLKKCCSAVVPKKRKRHMEIKHMGHGGKSKRREKTQSTKSSDRARNITTHDIFIDVNPQTTDEESFTVSTTNMQSVTSSLKGRTKREYSIRDDMCCEEVEDTEYGEGEQSFIIQPGDVLSIPMSAAQPVPQRPLSTKDSEYYYQRSSGRGAQQTPKLPTIASILSTSRQPASDVQQSDGKGKSNSAKGEHTVDGEDQNDNMDNSDGEKPRGQGSSKSNGSKQLKQKKRRYPTSRPFKCDQCDNAFNQRIHLKKHLSKHTGNIYNHIYGK